MIKFLCTLPLFKEIYRKGGIDSFPLAHRDIRETMRDDIEKMADDRLEEKIVELLTIVDPKMIVSFSAREKAVFIGGEKITDPGHLQSLKAEAELLLSSSLWQILHETPKELAQRAMFVAGESVSDMTKGRAMLHTLDTQKKILETLKSYQQPAVPPLTNRSI